MLIASKATKQYIQLLVAMTVKDFKARYKRALFGFLWVVINPLLQMIIIATIFSFFINVQVQNYPLFLFIGLLVWNFFSLSLTKATPSIVNERSLIQKAKFSRNVIPLSIVLSNFLHLLVSFILLAIWVLLFGDLRLEHIILAPAILLWLLALTSGISLLTSSFNVRFRDVSFFLAAGLILLFYSTPILYPLTLIPQKFHVLFFFNPLTSIVQIMQYALAGYEFPDLNLLITNLIISSLLIIVGIISFRKKSLFFDDWV